MCPEDLAPENHPLREIDAANDRNFIYGEAEGLYIGTT